METAPVRSLRRSERTAAKELQEVNGNASQIPGMEIARIDNIIGLAGT